MKKRYRYTNVPSVLQGDVPEDEAWCFFSGHTYDIDFHHIFGKTKQYKKRSEQYGYWIWLTHEEHDKLHHTSNGKKKEKKLKQECQKVFEKDHSRSEFIRLFGKNYL